MAFTKKLWMLPMLRRDVTNDMLVRLQAERKNIWMVAAERSEPEL